jgi:hypothetical protein
LPFENGAPQIDEALALAVRCLMQFALPTKPIRLI